MLNKEQIMEILPHRPPMLLVDEILEMDENHVVGALHLTGDEFIFQGHYQGKVPRNGKAGRYPSSGSHLHQAPRPDGSSRGHCLGR